MLTNALRNSAIFACVVVNIFIWPQKISGYETGPGCVRVRINEISCGRDTYEIKIALTNLSGSDAFVTEFTEEYFAQAETLGQWIKLKTDPGYDKIGNSPVPPGEELNLQSFVKIQLNLPSLYMNGFGEINLKFLYTLKVSCNGRTNLLEAGENLYWIAPGSCKWTLREGM